MQFWFTYRTLINTSDTMGLAPAELLLLLTCNAYEEIMFHFNIVMFCVGALWDTEKSDNKIFQQAEHNQTSLSIYA